MTTHAYISDYVEHAQGVLGDMLDFGVNTCNFTATEIMNNFINSGIADLFADGNPKYIVGMNGCELLKAVWEKCSLPVIEQPDVMYIDKSAEYWTGWVLAYYQWDRNISFTEIMQKIGIERVISMYYPYHEADIEKTIEILDDSVNLVRQKFSTSTGGGSSRSTSQ